MAVSGTVANLGPRVPTPEELVGRARSIVEDLRKLAPEADRLRRLPKESVALLKAQHLGRTIQPRSCGGYGLSMRAHVDVVSAVAEGCGATAWVLAVVHAHSWLMGHLPATAQQEVYGADPDMFVSAVIGPRGKAIRQANGTYRLSGVWPFASGCDHAGWFLFGAEVFDQSGAKIDEAKESGAREVAVWGSGTPRREFLYVDDLADALCFLMERYDSPEIINVGCGEDVTIAELASIVAGVVGFSAPVVFDRSKPDGTPRKLLDVSKLRALGWQARTPLADGLRATYDWYRTHGQRRS